jgi:signal transduction histidine kinase
MRAKSCQRIWERIELFEVNDTPEGNCLIGYYIPDFVVDEKVIVEIKALKGTDNSHIAHEFLMANIFSGINCYELVLGERTRAMIWNYAYTPVIWPSVGTVFLLLALAAYSWRRRSVPGALPFIVYCLLSVPMLIFKIIAYFAVDFETKVFWFKIESTFWLLIPTAMTCFVLEYAWPGRWLTRRNLALLSIVPLLSWALQTTNNSHHLVTTGYSFNGSVVPAYGPLGKLVVIYVLFLTILNIIVFTWLFAHSPQHRWPVVLMLVAQIFARGMTIIDFLTDESWFFYVPEMAFVIIASAIALFGFHIFDPVAMARQTMINQLSDGVLVLDRQGRFANLNPAAERVFQRSAGEIKGKPASAMLPAGIDDLLSGPGGGETELCLGDGSTPRWYALTVSLLNDWRGQEMGRLLLMRDVTEQKMAQAKIVEQQRALAMLGEREQLARELHDSLGQVLGYAGFQLEAVQGRIQDGQAVISARQAAASEQAGASEQADGAGLAEASADLAEAGSQLARLSSVVEEAHADVREHILNLRLAPSDQRPFFATLQHYLDGFSQNYGIQTVLTVGPEISEGMFDPGAQMQLYRIIQEALSNARKHAGASRVQVVFEQQDGQVRITILDNGRGFDPNAATPGGQSGPGHFGLRFMRERAEALGGCLAVISQPGEGTRVVVEVAVNSKR